MTGFLADENFPLESIQQLRDKGHDVASVLEQQPGATDRTVLQWARSEERIILTFDRDYGDLVYRLGLKAPMGLVFLRFDPLTPAEPSQRLIALMGTGNLTLEGKFTVLERARARQRPLPEETETVDG